MIDYDASKPLENYTSEELSELKEKIVLSLFKAGDETHPFDRRLLDMVTRQININCLKKFGDDMVW